MVQANADGRPRSRRARQSEEQAPLVESYLSSSGSTSYQGTPCLCPRDSQSRASPALGYHTPGVRVVEGCGGLRIHPVGVCPG